MPLDTHLMISNPIDYIEDFVKIGSEYITVHVEANNVLDTLVRIKSHQTKAGISLKPKTSINEIIPFFEFG